MAGADPEIYSIEASTCLSTAGSLINAHLVCETADCTKYNCCASSEHFISFHGFIDGHISFFHSVPFPSSQLYHGSSSDPWKNGTLQEEGEAIRK